MDLEEPLAVCAQRYGDARLPIRIAHELDVRRALVLPARELEPARAVERGEEVVEERLGELVHAGGERDGEHAVRSEERVFERARVGGEDERVVLRLPLVPLVRVGHHRGEVERHVVGQVRERVLHPGGHDFGEDVREGLALALPCKRVAGVSAKFKKK